MAVGPPSIAAPGVTAYHPHTGPAAATMHRLRTTPGLFVALLLAYGALCLPALVWPGWLDTPVGLVVAVPYVSIYLLDMLGIPGLLQNRGGCGWGWCPPSVFGWAFLAAVWLGVAWLIATGLARLLRRPAAAPDPDPDGR